jgi:hypothetical protein
MKSQFQLNVLGLLFVTTLSAANIPLQVVSVTSQQVEIQYASTISGPCTLSMTDNSGLGVTVWDVNGSKFANANQDLTRPDTLVNGQTRKVLLGHRVYQQGSDGKIYSMSLQADAPHTLALTCGTDTGTVSFSTLTIPQGQNYPELPQYCSGAGAMYGSHCWPTIDYTVAGKEIGYVDAFTGALVKRVTGPGESKARVVNAQAFSYVKDQSGTSAWTNPTNAFTYSSTGPYATASTLGAKLFIGWGQLIDPSNGVIAGGFQINNGNVNSVDDMRLRLRLLSTVNGDTVSTCATLDGQTCYSPIISCTITTGSTDYLIGSTGATNCAGGTWPGVVSGGMSTWTGPFAGWGAMQPPRRDLLSSPQLAVSVNGTAVTLPSPNYPGGVAFDADWVAGTPISITNSATACLNNLCTIASVTDTTHLTINENPGNIGAQTAQPAAGILVWKSAGTGTISVNANVDFAYSSALQLNDSGGYMTSSSPVMPQDTTSVTAAGATITGPAHVGSLAYFGCASVYFFDETTGSARLLDSGFFTTIGLGLNGNNGYGAGDGSCLTDHPFSLTDPRSWFFLFNNVQPTTQATTTSGTFGVGTSGSLASCIDFTVPGEGIYIANAGQTGPGFDGHYHGTLVSCTGTTLTVTPATFASVASGTIVAHNESVIYQNRYSGDYRSQLFQWPCCSSVYGNVSRALFTTAYPNDIQTKFTALVNSGCPSCLTYLKAMNAGLVHSYPGFGGFFDNGLASMAGGPGQNSVYWAFPFDIVNNRFTGMLDTFSTPSGRWGNLHSAFPAGGSGYTFTSISNIQNGIGLAGEWATPVTQVWRSNDGITGAWDNNTCENDLLASSNCQTTLAPSGSTVAAYNPPYAYSCPAGTFDYWTTTSSDAANQLLQLNGGRGGPYTPTFFGQNNCIQVRVGGQPCSTNFTSAELAAYPCPWGTAGTQTWLQDFAVGDIWTDKEGYNCSDCEHGVIVQITMNTSTDIQLWIYRAAMGGGTVSQGTAVVPYPGKSPQTPFSPINTFGANKLNRSNGWTLTVDTPAFGGPWWFNSANPSAGWVIGTYLLDGSHTDPGAHITGSIFSQCALSTPTTLFGYNCLRFSNLPGDLSNTSTNVATGYAPYFNNSQAFGSPLNVTGILETYPSAQASNGTNDFKRWLSDYHDPTNGDGTGFEQAQGLFGGITISLVSGFSHVYDITIPGQATLDEKNSPLYGNSGRYTLQNISGPGALINDSKLNAMCWSRLTGDCFTTGNSTAAANSIAGHIYITPKSPDTAHLCNVNQMMISSPCTTPTPSIYGQSILNNVIDPNPEGSGHIRLTGMFNSPMNTAHFEHLRFTQSGLWGFYGVNFGAGYRESDVFAVRIPRIATDTVNRTGFVQVPLRLPAGNSVVIRFGYDSSFRCSGVTDSQGNFISGYNDSCLTVASPTQSEPYMWSSEGAVRPILCTSGCVIRIPGISGRYMYYRVERYLSGVLTYQGQTQRLPVP